MSSLSSNIILDRINLRLPNATFEAIDLARATRPGQVSRNTWITEAIEEKLAREALPDPSKPHTEATGA